LVTLMPGDIDAGNATVTLNAILGAIDDAAANPDATADISADTIDLDAATGIGATAHLELDSATSIDADTTNGNVDIDNAADAGVTVNSITTGTGTINYDQTGGQTLGVTLATTTDGAIVITNDNAALTATTVTAGGWGRCR